MSAFCPDDNPLASDAPEVWDGLIEALGPASMLVAIGARMGAPARQRWTPEDLWLETLLIAWRDRARVQWRGLTHFRRWLLQVCEHRLVNLVEAATAHKRGDGVTPAPLAPPDGAGEGERDTRPSHYAGPVASTTPSRAAADRELADGMARALAELPEDDREVVRLRLFDGLLLDAIAAQLGLSEAAVRRRFRRGAELYRQRLRGVAGSTWATSAAEAAAATPAAPANRAPPRATPP